MKLWLQVMSFKLSHPIACDSFCSCWEFFAGEQEKSDSRERRPLCSCWEVFCRRTGKDRQARPDAVIDETQLREELKWSLLINSHLRRSACLKMGFVHAASSCASVPRCFLDRSVSALCHASRRVSRAFLIIGEHKSCCHLELVSSIVSINLLKSVDLHVLLLSSQPANGLPKPLALMGLTLPSTHLLQHRSCRVHCGMLLEVWRQARQREDMQRLHNQIWPRTSYVGLWRPFQEVLRTHLWVLGSLG